VSGYQQGETAAPPDLEAHVLTVLDALGGIRVWAYDSRPAVQNILEVTNLQVDVRAASKKTARDRAYTARALLLGLPVEAWDAGLVSEVTVVSGPLWQPDQDGAPRYVIRVAVQYQAR
jgi:hypothetical protein